MIPYAPLVAMLASLALAAATLARGPLRLPKVSFAVGMGAFALEAALTYGLLHYSQSLESNMPWLIALRTVALLVPIPWTLFAFVSARHQDATIPWAWRACFAAGGLGLAATAAAGLVWPFYALPQVDGPFKYALLTPVGQIGVIVEVLATIAVLYGLEPSVRKSYGTTRWRLKYLALGLGGIFVVRFYFLSQLLLFQTLVREGLEIASVTLLGGLAFSVVGLVRTDALRGDLSVSRHFVYRSIVVGICGVYLMLAGLAGWVLNTLGIPDKAFWGSLVLFVSALGLASLLLSESLRWRVRRYVSTHFYASKHDYREQWRSFTDTLATRVTVDGIGGQLLRSVMETLGTTRGALYLADRSDRTLQLAVAQGTGRLPQSLAFTMADFSTRPAGPEAALLTAIGNGRVEPFVAAGFVVAVPLPAHGELVGVLLVGAERTDAPYSQEDLDLLSTLGEQGASAIATARLSEQLAESRAFDAFNRLSSFIIHDLKNSISALSLLTQNAKRHFDDPEFRQDALRTLDRTVARMQSLLGRLSRGQAGDGLVLEDVSLNDLTEDLVTAALAGTRVRPTLELEAALPARADVDAIQRVLQNLITNAVEAMDGEGEITVRTVKRDGLVGCSVTDTGCGMSEEFIRKSLFVPFSTTKKGGWGIGLYQAREIVAAHGGRLEVASQEGRGTTVTLLLPEAAP
jgi:signal transduction histidine kinase